LDDGDARHNQTDQPDQHRSFLARLLQPTDFGIVAIAMLIVGGVEIFSAAGQRAAIVRYINRPWTITTPPGRFRPDRFVPGHRHLDRRALRRGLFQDAQVDIVARILPSARRCRVSRISAR